MSLPVTVYRWDDPGAPQISDKTPAEWLTVFKKCLVEGYGDKQSAGWSVAYEDETQQAVVLRNSQSQGSGGYVKIWKNNSERLDIKSAPILTSISPDWGAVANTSYRLRVNLRYAIRWVIIATAAGFYISSSGTDGELNLMHQRTREFPCFFVGDFDSFYNGDANTFTVLAANLNNDNEASSWSRGLGYLDDKTYISRLGEVDGTNRLVSFISICPFRTARGQVINGEPSALMTLGPISIQTYYFAAHGTASVYVDSEGINLHESSLQPAVRGLIPGLVQSSISAFSDYQWPVIKVMDNTTYFLLPNPHIGACYLWVNMETWYG